MPFVRVTDPDEAREYNVAGMLWEQTTCGDMVVSYGWTDRKGCGWAERLRSMGGRSQFFILTEE